MKLDPELYRDDMAIIKGMCVKLCVTKLVSQ